MISNYDNEALINSKFDSSTSAYLLRVALNGSEKGEKPSHFFLTITSYRERILSISLENLIGKTV
jgi:hypothetical protein